MTERDPSISPNSQRDEEDDDGPSVVWGAFTPSTGITISAPQGGELTFGRGQYNIVQPPAGRIEVASPLETMAIGNSVCAVLRNGAPQEHIGIIEIGQVRFSDGTRSICICEKCGNLFLEHVNA